MEATTTRLDRLKEAVKALLDKLSKDEGLILMERIQRYDIASRHDPDVLARYLAKVLEEHGVTI